MTSSRPSLICFGTARAHAARLQHRVFSQNYGKIWKNICVHVLYAANFTSWEDLECFYANTNTSTNKTTPIGCAHMFVQPRCDANFSAYLSINQKSEFKSRAAVGVGNGVGFTLWGPWTCEPNSMAFNLTDVSTGTETVSDANQTNTMWRNKWVTVIGTSIHNANRSITCTAEQIRESNNGQ